MITDEEIVSSMKAFTGPGIEITDEFIDFTLASLHLRTPKSAALTNGICQSESMRRLVRCWCNQRVGMSCDQREATLHDSMLKEIKSGFIPEIILGLWFMPFETTVISSMTRIHTLESMRHSPGQSQRSPIESIKQARDDELSAFDSSTVEAFHKLRDAAKLLGVPQDFFTSRPLDRDDIEKETLLDDQQGDVRYRSTCAPFIQKFPEHLIRLDSYNDERDPVAAVAEIYNSYRNDLKHAGRGGKQTFEGWAIRKLWSDISDAFNYAKSLPEIDKPWATVRDVLALCNVAVDSEMVRKTVGAG